MADTAPILRCVSDRGHVLSLLWPDGAMHLHVYHGYRTTRPVVFRRPRDKLEARIAFIATLPPSILDQPVKYPDEPCLLFLPDGGYADP